MATESRFVPAYAGALILTLQALLLAFRLGDVPLLGPDEPRYARVAVEMARANEWATPTLAGEPWLEKPVLYYWAAGLLFRVFGETEFAARLPATLAALLLTGSCGVVASRLFGARAGVVAMLAASLQPLTFAYGRAATMDMLVAAFVTVACGFLALRRLGLAGPTAVTGAWAAMALAALAKGPIGLVLPLGFLALSAALDKKLVLRECVTAPAVFVFLAIAAPWHVAVFLENGWNFVEVFILNHNVQRFTSTIHNHPGPLYYYAPILVVGLFPFSGLAIAGLLRGLDVSARRALLAWLLVPFLLFSAAGSKLPGYVLPCVPPLAIFAGAAAAYGGNAILFRGLTAALGLALGGAAAWGVASGAWWSSAAAPPASWAAIGALVLAGVPSTRSAARLATVVGAGFLLLLTLGAPPVLSARESGRALFLPSRGRDVVVVSAWRTAWMSGYFYNDGRVIEVASVEALLSGRPRPELVLCGPPACLDLRSRPALQAIVLARGPRDTELLRLTAPDPPETKLVGFGRAAAFAPAN